MLRRAAARALFTVEIVLLSTPAERISFGSRMGRVNDIENPPQKKMEICRASSVTGEASIAAK